MDGSVGSVCEGVVIGAVVVCSALDCDGTDEVCPGVPSGVCDVPPSVVSVSDDVPLDLEDVPVTDAEPSKLLVPRSTPPDAQETFDITSDNTIKTSNSFFIGIILSALLLPL